MTWFRVLGLALWLTGCTVNEFENTRPVNPAESARSRVAIAANYLQQGEQDKALRHLQRALEQDPRSAEAHTVMGVLMEQEGDDRRAEEHYRKALSLRSDYPQAHNNYGVMLFRLKRYDESIKALTQAAANLGYDRRESTFENLGKAYLAVKDTDQARQAFEKALKLDSRLPVASLELAWLAHDRGDKPVANLYFQRHLKALGAEMPSPRSLALGVLLARDRGDGDAEAGYLAKLKRHYPGSAEYRTLMSPQGR